MKKILFLLIIPFMLFASKIDYEIKIYDTIFYNIYPNKYNIKIWCDSKKASKIVSEISNIKIVDDKKNADILFITKDKNIELKTMKFVTSYKLLKRYRDSAIGGFYWKKGRPNILFLKKNMLKYHIKLPPSFNDYIEDEL